MLSGSVVAQVITFVSLPFLTRFFPKTQIGIAETIMAAAVGLAPLLTLALPQVYMTAQNGSQRSALQRTASWWAVLVSAVAAPIVVARVFPDVDSANETRILVLVLFLTMIGVSLYEMASSVALVSDREKRIPIARVTIAVITRVVPLLLLLFGSSPGRFALAWCLALGWLIPSLLLSGPVRWPTVENLHSVRTHYGMFAIAQSFTRLSNSLSASLPVLLSTTIFGSDSGAEVGVVFRLVMAPIVLVSSSIARTFVTEIVRKSSMGEKLDYFRRYSGYLTIIGVFGGLVGVGVGPLVFRWYLGHDWLSTNVHITPIMLLMSSRFIVSPLSMVLLAQKRYGTDLVAAIGSLALRTVAFTVGAARGLNIALWLYSISGILSYGILYYLSRASLRLTTIETQ